MNRIDVYSFRACLFALPLALFGWVSPLWAQAFQLSGVTFSDSSYLPDDELQAAVRPYLNRDIEFSDVQKMMSDVQALYVARGVVTAKAIIEPQAVTDGTLRVTLVEARLQAVDIDPGPHTKAAFLRERISLTAGAQPDFEALARDVRLFEVAYDVRPTFEFSPGSDAATTRAKVGLDAPAKRLSWSVSVDNKASRAVGRYQISVASTVRSLTGVRDTLRGQLTANRGGYNLSLTYRRPLGLRGGNIDLAASYGSSKIVEGEFNVLGVTTTTGSFSAGYSAPFRIRANSHWTWNIGARYEPSKSETNGVQLQSTALTEAEAGIAYQRSSARRSWSVSFGAKAGTATSANSAATDGPYWLLSAGASYQQRLGDRFILDAKVNAQYAEGQNLPARRAFSVGGAETLRGYVNSARSGDSGLSGRLQVICVDPCWSRRSLNIKLSPFAFVDFGYVKPFSTTSNAGDRQHGLASAGVGVRASYGKFQGIAFVGQPLIATPSQTTKGPTFYAGLDYAF